MTATLSPSQLIYKSRLRSGVQRRTALRSHSSLITNRNWAKPLPRGLAQFYLVIETKVSAQASNMAGCLDVIEGMRDNAARVEHDR